MSDSSPPLMAALPTAGLGVAVVIPARNSAGTLEAAIRSALDQVLPDRVTGFGVTVAVGPSSDDTAAVARRVAAEDPRVHVVDNPVGSTPAALNAAVAASMGEVVVRLDAHAVLPPGYLDTAIQALTATGAANVGGRQVPVAEAGFARAVAAAMLSPLGTGGAMYRTGTTPGPAETVYLGVFRRSALDAVGAFDESLLRNQDFELNHRLRESGRLVWFDPRLEVTYRPRTSVRELWRQYHDYGRWKRHVLRLHPASLQSRQLAPTLLVLGLLAGLVAWPLWSVGPLAALVALWLGVLMVEGMRVARPRSDAGAVALALATMHLAWGLGFLRGGVGR